MIFPATGPPFRDFHQFPPAMFEKPVPGCQPQRHPNFCQALNKQSKEGGSQPVQFLDPMGSYPDGDQPGTEAAKDHVYCLVIRVIFLKLLITVYIYMNLYTFYM